MKPKKTNPHKADILMLVVGQIKKSLAYLQPGIDLYLKRLNHYAQVTVIEVADAPILPSKTTDQVLAEEAKSLMPYLEQAAYCIALSEHGKVMNSCQFAAHFFETVWPNRLNGGFSTGGHGSIIFIVGGPLGLHPEIINHSHLVLSLSAMTFAHPMVRLILLEQLYRAFKINRNEPYHK
ncbi:MAG: 23S rRNA (pseudouridine(1915)-N(3))-methyltransferase RlmH [Cyanobacteria bacterium P01_H01_bin.74]